MGKTSLANQAVSCLPADAACQSGREEQRRMALPTGSLAVSTGPSNFSRLAPWRGVWEAQPHEGLSCSALCTLLLLWLISIPVY